MAGMVTQPNGQSRCPLCSSEAPSFPVSGLDGRSVDCARCGSFKLTRQLERNFGRATQDDQDLMPFVGAYVRRMNEQGIKPLLGTNDWKERARAHAATPLIQKIDRLLELLGRRGRPGKTVLLDPDCDSPLFDARDADESQYLLRYLLEEKLLSYDVRLMKGKDEGKRHCELSVAGWTRLEPGIAGSAGRCFVAMSFHESLAGAYNEGIYPALKVDCQLDPCRIDREEHNDRIDDRIMVEIRRAQFIVADVTRQRAGVYFEAGFAMGLGRPVIWTCREDDLPNVHFDTRQYPHVLWTSPADLRAKLTTRVRATIPGVRP